jgi:hypothetical protein
MAADYNALKPGDLPEAFTKLKKLLMPPTRPKEDRKRLEELLEKLTADLTRARGNLVLLDPPRTSPTLKSVSASWTNSGPRLSRS